MRKIGFKIASTLYVVSLICWSVVIEVEAGKVARSRRGKDTALDVNDVIEKLQQRFAAAVFNNWRE